MGLMRIIIVRRWLANVCLLFNVSFRACMLFMDSVKKRGTHNYTALVNQYVYYSILSLVMYFIYEQCKRGFMHIII